MERSLSWAKDSVLALKDSANLGKTLKKLLFSTNVYHDPYVPLIDFRYSSTPYISVNNYWITNSTSTYNIC